MRADQTGDILTIPVSITVIKGTYRITDITLQIDDQEVWTYHYFDAKGDYTIDMKIKATAGLTGETIPHKLSIILRAQAINYPQPDHEFAVVWNYIPPVLTTEEPIGDLEISGFELPIIITVIVAIGLWRKRDE